MNNIFYIYVDNNNFRNDIQGIRALSAILVLVFHIWFQKVSGGVDVFFVISGFLMTGMLLRQYAKEEKIKPFKFWGGIIKRVTPSAYIVILTTFFFCYFFIPPVYWIATIHEFVFSAAHLENLLLMRREVDYLNSGDPASPFQQYWALSIQVQFYAFLPLFIGFLLYLSNRMRTLAPLMLGVLFGVCVSFAYSVISTNLTPDTAYFNPLARVWEFLVGSLTAMVIPFLRVSNKLATLLSFLGVFLLFSVGIFFPSEWDFPGYIALFPVSAAVLLIVSGHGKEKNTVINKILSNRYLVMLGAISFTLYLWHWPILVFFQYYYETTSLGFVKGMLIVMLGIFLAIITTLLVERPIQKIPKARTWFPYVVGLIFFIPSIVLGLGAKYYLENLHDIDVYFKNYTFKGTEISIQNDASELNYGYVTAISNDLGEAMDKDSGCATVITDSTILSCEFGDTSSEKIIALVGGSHIGQWTPFFSSLAEELGFKLLTVLKHSCSLGYKIVLDNETCEKWNGNIVDYLHDVDPLLVITNSTRSNRLRNNRLVEGNPIEFVPDGYVKKWEEITTLGIPIIGIRDNPWFERDPSYCVWKNRLEAGQCARPVEEVLLPQNPADEYAIEIPLFTSIDFTELICSEGLCPAYFDGRLMWSDTHHLTRTYLEYISPSLKESLERQTSFFQTFEYQKVGD